MTDEYCGAVWDSPTGRTNVCVRPAGHDGPHTVADGTAVWVDSGQPPFGKIEIINDGPMLIGERHAREERV